MHALFQTFIKEKLVRSLNGDAGTVTRIVLTTTSAAMLHVFEDGERI